MKTILHIITGLEPGGAESVLLRMTTALRNYHHVVVSLSTRGALAAPLEQHGASVKALQIRRPTSFIAAPLRLRRIIREARPDLIQSWLVHANFLSALGRRALTREIPLVWNVRQSLDALDKEKWLTCKIISASPLLARIPAAIIYNSNHAARQHEAMGYPSSSREVIPNGFNTEEFAPRQDIRNRVRSELGIEGDAILIGLVGRFHPVKNHAGFFEAATRVLHAEPRAYFLLAGTGTETERMLPFIENDALRERLIGLGPRRDIVRITCALDIACNVSHSESFPNNVGEAMACEVPCVVTPVGESRHIVDDTGIVTNDTSGASIASSLLRMIALGPEAKSDLGRRARKRIENSYSLSAVALRYQELYERLLAGRVPTPETARAQ